MKSKSIKTKTQERIQRCKLKNLQRTVRDLEGYIDYLHDPDGNYPDEEDD